ncbi:ABC transporter permease subunit [bacterium]|nr:ABC transporter permease subunit [bacterium]
MSIDQSKAGIPFYRDQRVISWAAQIISALMVLGLIAWAGVNFVAASKARGLNLSYAFLKLPAGFPISDPGISYDPSMSFGRAFLVGLANTLRVSVIGIILATILGTLVAFARLSNNWLLNKIALAYIEFHRNIPLLVLLFLWYFTVFQQLPNVNNAIRLPGPIYFTQRGVYLTWPRLTDTSTLFLILSAIGVVSAVVAFILLRRKRTLTGKPTHHNVIAFGLLVGFPLLGWIIAPSAPLYLDIPALAQKNFEGGVRLVPEFAALLVGLTTYTAAFIAEVVRAGIQAVPKGQVEAARALGLNNRQVTSLVIFPQALRVMIPPMISQYLNLTKNSSLALAIGFQDLFSVGKIAINQAGRAVPVFAMVMGSYLVMSLLTSFVLNIYNKRIQFAER